MVCISVCSSAQTTKTTTTKSVTTKTTTTTYKQPKASPMSASDQAFFDELHQIQDDWVAERKAFREQEAASKPIRDALNKVRDSMMAAHMADKPPSIPVVLSKESQTITQPVIYIGQVNVIPVTISKRPTTTRTVYTDQWGYQRVVTSTRY
jgi:hypothetical protein